MAMFIVNLKKTLYTATPNIYEYSVHSVYIIGNGFRKFTGNCQLNTKNSARNNFQNRKRGEKLYIFVSLTRVSRTKGTYFGTEEAKTNAEF